MCEIFTGGPLTVPMSCGVVPLTEESPHLPPSMWQYMEGMRFQSDDWQACDAVWGVIAAGHFSVVERAIEADSPHVAYVISDLGQAFRRIEATETTECTSLNCQHGKCSDCVWDSARNPETEIDYACGGTEVELREVPEAELRALYHDMGNILVPPENIPQAEWANWYQKNSAGRTRRCDKHGVVYNPGEMCGSCCDEQLDEPTCRYCGVSDRTECRGFGCTARLGESMEFRNIAKPLSENPAPDLTAVTRDIARGG